MGEVMWDMLDMGWLWLWNSDLWISLSLDLHPMPVDYYDHRRSIMFYQLFMPQFDALVAALPLSDGGEEAQLKRIAELQVWSLVIIALWRFCVLLYTYSHFKFRNCIGWKWCRGTRTSKAIGSCGYMFFFPSCQAFLQLRVKVHF